MIFTTVIFLFLALVLYFINMKKGMHMNGLRAGLRGLITVLPAILLALLLAGMLEVLIPEEFVKRWLAGEAGLTGVLLGTLGGMLMAVGPYASYPIIATIYASGAGLGTTIALITGWTFLGLSRVPFESGFLGLRFSLFRIALHIPVCIAAGLIAHWIELLFM